MTHAAQDSVALRAQAEHIADIYSPQSYGRPALLEDPDKVHLLLASIRDGNYREIACRQAGISKRCLYDWLSRAETGDEGAQAFVQALEKAEADAEADMVRNVRNAGKLPQFWAANATYLERKYPDRWGRRTDESASPKVIVQVGGHASDVKVLIQAGPSPDPETLPALSPASLSPVTLGAGEGEGHANEGGFAPSCLIKTDYVNLRADIPSGPDVSSEPNGGAGFAGAGQAVPGAPRRAGSSSVKASRKRRGRVAKDVRAERYRHRKPVGETEAMRVERLGAAWARDGRRKKKEARQTVSVKSHAGEG